MKRYETTWAAPVENGVGRDCPRPGGTCLYKIRTDKPSHAEAQQEGSLHDSGHRLKPIRESAFITRMLEETCDSPEKCPELELIFSIGIRKLLLVFYFFFFYSVWRYRCNFLFDKACIFPVLRMICHILLRHDNASSPQHLIKIFNDARFYPTSIR